MDSKYREEMDKALNLLNSTAQLSPYTHLNLKWKFQNLIPRLSHEYAPLVEIILQILLNIAIEDIELPEVAYLDNREDDVKQLLIELSKIFALFPGPLDKRCILGVTLLNVLLYHHREARPNPSYCFSAVLKLFSSLNIQEKQEKLLNQLVETILIATTDPYLSLHDTAEVVIPKVVQTLRFMNVNSWPSKYGKYVLKMLHLCRYLIKVNLKCQLLFINNGGLHVLKGALQGCTQNDFLVEQNIPQLSVCQTRKEESSMYSSLSWVVDVVVTHNYNACQKALDLQIPEELFNHLCLPSTSPEQTGGIFSALAHIFESQMCVPQKYIETLYYVSRRKEFPHGDVGPHLMKFIQDHFNNIKNVSVSKVLSTVSRFNKTTQMQQLQICAAPTQFKTKLQSAHKRKCCISKAELMWLLKSVEMHGLNMKAVRKCFPFHPSLTASELYTVWRTLWDI